jgi:tRNA (mo5U34)-methyltransferase
MKAGVESLEIDVPDISPERVGSFNVVLFIGVLYHLRHPLLGLERAASVAKDTLIVETVLDAHWMRRPAMVFYPGSERNGDPTNWWGPNAACVIAMLKDLGFKQVERFNDSVYKERAHFIARR